jgi:hypothetical protein
MLLITCLISQRHQKAYFIERGERVQESSPKRATAAPGMTRSPAQSVILAAFEHLQINDVLCDQVKAKQRREASHRTDGAKLDGPFDQQPDSNAQGVKHAGCNDEPTLKANASTEAGISAPWA